MFFINGKLSFINGPRNLLTNRPDCTISDSLVCLFDSLMLAADLIPKVLRRLVACQSVNNSVSGKLFALLPITFDDNLRVNSVVFHVSDFKLSEADNWVYRVVQNFFTTHS